MRGVGYAERSAAVDESVLGSWLRTIAGVEMDEVWIGSFQVHGDVQGSTYLVTHIPLTLAGFPQSIPLFLSLRTDVFLMNLIGSLASRLQNG